MQVIFIIISLVVTAFALENAPQMSIDAQIAQIKSAPASQRVRLMNAFKMRISQMNKQERAAAIKEIQVKMQTKHDTMPRHNHITRMQSHDSMEVQKFQKMYQKQVADQFMKEGREHRPVKMIQPHQKEQIMDMKRR